MLNQIAVAALAGLAAAGDPGAARDTSFAVSAGTRLEVNNRSGSIHVRGAEGDRVRIAAGDRPTRALRIRRSGSVVRVSVSERWRSEQEDDEVDLSLDVPRATSLRLQGVETEIRVDGVSGSVEAETVDEGVTVRGPARSVRARSIDDDVVVAGARGRVDLYSVDGDLRVSDVEGELAAESIDGDLVLRGVRSGRVQGSTMDGDVLFEGPIRNGGEYTLSTHDGDLWLTVEEGTSASFEVSLHSGSVDASFPLSGVETESGGHTYHFVAGDGSARVDLRSFDGVVFLRRPGELPDDRMPDADRDG